MSIRLKQVWAFGKLFVQASIWCMVKSRGPAAPCSALKPCRGTREDPVTNWSNRARLSSSKNSTAFQNHLTTLLSGVQCFNRVLTFQSLTSILPSPQIMSSSSFSSNVFSRCWGMTSLKPFCSARN